MMSDLPHTLYNHSSKDSGGKVKQKDIDDAARLTLEAAERKRKAREEENKKNMEVTVEELFAGVED